MDSEVNKREELKKIESEKPVKFTDDYNILLNMGFYFKARLWKRLSESRYAIFSIIDKNDQDRHRFS